MKIKQISGWRNDLQPFLEQEITVDKLAIGPIYNTFVQIEPW